MKAKINFVGDISLFKKNEELNIDPFEEIWLPESDWNVGNFEFIIPNNREKNFFDVQDAYKCSYSFFNKLKINKFNMFGLANNHCMDYGVKGVQDTIKVFNNKGIKHFGFNTSSYYSASNFCINGITFCIIGAIRKGRWSKAKNKGCGPDEYNKKNIIELIQINKSKVDHIIIFPHWGSELIDIPPPQNIEDAKLFIAKGACAVIGHHPHVCQGIEKYGDGIIAYSLGSFIYIPSEELGYDGLEARDISMCLQVEFNKNSILSNSVYLYKHNTNKLIPEHTTEDSVIKYFNDINENIYNSKLYYKKFKSILLKREWHSFLIRLLHNPFKTFCHYFRIIRLDHLKKIFHLIST